VQVLKEANYDLIVLETSGIGQSDTEIIEHSDLSLYVMTPEYGAASQLEKIDMLDFADIIALNKFDKRGALDAIRDVKKQYKRNHKLWETKDEELPVYGTIASQFNDPGMNELYRKIIDKINEKTGSDFKSSFEITGEMSEKIYIIPPARTRYLSEITETIRNYNTRATEQSEIAQKLFGIKKTIETVRSSEFVVRSNTPESSTNSELQATNLINQLEDLYKKTEINLEGSNRLLLEEWDNEAKRYHDEFYVYKVRDKDVKVKTHYESLSHIQIPKIAVPNYNAWGERLQWALQENYPGKFPFTAGVYPFKRMEEDPTRMFAGEGGPERTNRRFHYVSIGLPAKRLSTAFDSVTLYGHDPDYRPDIYGKIGNSGVSICCLDDAKKLYSGFHLADAKTSVSKSQTGATFTLLQKASGTASSYKTTYDRLIIVDQEGKISFKGTNLVSSDMDAAISNINSLLTTTDIPKTESAFEIELYPNPVESVLHVKLKAGLSGDVSVVLQNINGQTIQTIGSVASGDNNTYTLDIENVTPGFYFVNVKIGNETKVFKIVKN
jgi:methylmalonyl-CoA mutase